LLSLPSDTSLSGASLADLQYLGARLLALLIVICVLNFRIP